MSVMHDDARSTVSFRKPSLPSNSIQNRDIQSGSVANPSQMFPFFSSNPLGRAVGSGLSAKDHTNSNLLTYWSLDLNAIDDAVEASLLDPSSTGPLYMRLLVKTIGVLHCEDDVERMLLDSLYQSFVERIVSRCKERAQLKMAQLVRDHGPFADEDEETLFYGKTFAQYSGALLDALLGLIQRLLFVFR